jgi:murein DD-endopeptidase MepM/ murein hydrolase activator NlpD
LESKNPEHDKFKLFLKKNSYYLIMAVCVMVVVGMIAVAIITSNDVTPEPIIETPDDTLPITDDITNETDEPAGPSTPEEPITPELPVVFLLPVANGSVVRNYTMTSPIMWKTLGHFAVHDGIDFSGDADLDVLAVLDGEVSDKTYDLLNGHVVKIDHGGGLITIYGSLSEPSVEIGQSLRAGQKIATISDSASSELELGKHLHFAVYLNDEAIDPYVYLPLGDK